MRHFVQNCHRKRIPFPACLQKRNAVLPVRKVHFCFKVLRFAQNPVGNIPAGCPAHEAAAVSAAAFQTLVRRNEHVPGFPRPAIAPAEQFPVKDQPAADAGADGHINHVAAPASCPKTVFRKSCAVAVVIQNNRNRQVLRQIIPHGKIPDVLHGGRHANISLVKQDKGGHTDTDPAQISDLQVLLLQQCQAVFYDKIRKLWTVRLGRCGVLASADKVVFLIKKAIGDFCSARINSYSERTHLLSAFLNPPSQR